MKKIYISDLDGTLLNSSGQLSDYSHKMLNKLIADGASISLASARNVASIRQLMTGVSIKLPVIEINGAFVSDLKSGRHLCINSIPQDISEKICDLCADNGCVPFVAAFDGEKDHLFYEAITNDGMEWFVADKTEDHSNRLKRSRITPEILDMDIVCFVLIGEFGFIRDINDIITKKFGDRLDSFFFTNPYNLQWQWLTIHDKNARKSNGVKELLEMKGFTNEQLVVFGDNDNDIAMMELNKSGARSVAVENAIEQVKSIASEVCLSNDNDGVVRYICEDFYGKKDN